MKMIDPRDRQPAEGSLVFVVKSTLGGAGRGTVGLALYEDAQWYVMPAKYAISDETFLWLEDA